MTLKYTTVSQFAEILGLKNDIPTWEPSSAPVNEAVGTGDNIVTVFYLDQRFIISETYTLYANDVAMTETTHYSLELDTGKITLTTAGKTLLNTDDLTAKYSYINNGMSNAYLTRVLERAEKEVDDGCNSIFIDTSSDNPDYILETEIQASEGYFQDRIMVEKKPLIDISTPLNGAVDISQVTIDLASGAGANFPSTGSIIIGSEVITYTGITTDQLTGVTRGAMSTTAATHDDGDYVHSTILFTSDTQEGSPVVFTVQPWDNNMFANEYGLTYLFKDSNLSLLSNAGVSNRIKILYYYGYDSLPTDITRLSLIFGKRQLIQDNIGKSMIAGRDEFKPEMFNVDMDEINRILNAYRVLPMGNT